MMVWATHGNHKIWCPLAEKCERYCTPERAWNDKRKPMCWGKADNFMVRKL